MAHRHDSKSLSRFSTAEEYTRRFILLSFQPIISYYIDLFGIRCGRDHHPFFFQLNRAGIESIGL